MNFSDYLPKIFFILASVLLLNSAFVNFTTYANRSEAFITADSTGTKQVFPTITITQSRIKISNDSSDNTTITKLYSTAEDHMTYTFTPGEYDVAPGEYGHLIGGDYVPGYRNNHCYIEYN
jgi:hypothetical protein